MSSCDKDNYWDENNVGIGNGGVIMASPFYAEASIDGKKREFKDGQDGYRNTFGSKGVSLDGFGTFLEKQKVAFDGSQNITVYFMERFLDEPSNEDIKNMFRKGKYNFGNSNAGSSGVEIEYKDASGTVWSTSNGSGMQAGSSFEVINHYSNHFDTYTPYITEAVFSCKLYDDNGNVMELNNGRVVARTVVTH
ncbi:MAG: hypothetical protein EA412_02020 [Chitinophagaceae bacterium]|nr:MAG: hypothetical protein EA412_02020 [Chitinophagaceae bacterium]